MSTNTSLKKSLSIGLTLGVSFLWLLSAIASGLVIQKEINESFDKALKKSAQYILPLAIKEALHSDSDHRHSTVLSFESDDEYLSYVVRDRKGNWLLQSKEADTKIFNKHPRLGFSNSETHRIYTTSALNHRIFLDVAEPLEHRNGDIMEAGVALLLPLLFLVPVSLFGIWFIVRFSLRKVVAFQNAIEHRGVGDLSPIKMHRLPDELSPIAVAVNRLLERLRRALEAERNFTANSAHELRTPLATALAKVQRLKAVAQNAAFTQQITDVETSLKSLSKQSEKLLQLAKAEGAGAISEKPHNLIPILEMVVGDFTRQSPDCIKLHLPTESITSLLDPDAFAILVRNLLENAIEHGRNSQPVELSFLADGTFRVVNDCDVIKPEDLVRLRNRFVRINTAVSGSGLGLAIVDAVASAAGITLSIRSPATGRQGGFEAELNVQQIALCGDKV